MICFDSKIAIIGAGNVGSTLAYTCMLQGLASQIVLIDVDKEKAAGQALDMNHCLQFTPNSPVIAGDSYALVQGANIVVITAGAAQRPGQSRLELLEANVSLFKKIIPAVVEHNSDCVLLVVTNPMDVLTYVAYKLSGFPANRVLGSGTVLDTARLRFLLGKKFSVSPKDICAYVLGEHGDSEFIWWSAASLAGIPLSLCSGYSKDFEQQVLEQTRHAAYEIIQQKGATYYAIALAAAKIIKALLFNQSRVFTVSSLAPAQLTGGEEIFLSLPLVLKPAGEHTHLAINFTSHENETFRKSMTQIREGIVQAQKILNSS
jgi:L-lactate dehydrogenase